jgi:hypothetical protein
VHLVTGLPERGERPVVVVDDDRAVTLVGDLRLVGVEEVDLRPVAPT